MILKSDESNFINEVKKKLIELLDRENRETYKVLRILKSKSMNVKKIYKNASGNWKIGKKRIVKFRVYHEENAKEKVLRYILKKKVIIETQDKHTDFTIDIEDSNLFLRWIRSMGVSAVVLEPKDLRDRMINEVLDWQKNCDN